ncbi:hypothetical protein [Streptomyces sp. NPDC057381]
MTDKQPEKKSRVRINLGQNTQKTPPEKQSRVRINLGGRRK